MGKPVIATVNGFALEGGCELPWPAYPDRADSARFSQPEISRALAMPAASIARRVKGLAFEILLTGDMIARSAHGSGTVHKVVPAAEDRWPKRRSSRMASKAPIAVRFIIGVNQGLDAPFPVAEFLETSLFGAIASSADMKEGPGRSRSAAGLAR